MEVEESRLYDTLRDGAPLEEIEAIMKDTLLCLGQTLNDSANKSAAQLINRAVEFIHQNYSCDISLDDIAGHVYFSPSYFSQFFRMHMGITFSEYLFRYRMEKAVNLLKQMNMKVQDVSAQVGYQNSRYFSKMFKRYTGLTPTEYQTQLQARRS